MEKLGRYYTNDLFSELLVKNLGNKTPQNILELGVGEGALIKAAYKRWVNASFYVADIDNKSLKKVQKELPFVKSFHFDLIKEDISEKIIINSGLIDMAICNPPYLKLKNDIQYFKLFQDAKLEGCKTLKTLTTDLIFLAKNLQVLKNNGELGIILPDGLITGKDFELLRFSLLNNHNLKAVIQLPSKVFKKTDALTYILIIEKGINKILQTPLFLANRDGQIIDQIDVPIDKLVERMDYKYHSWNKNIKKSENGLKKECSLFLLNPEIKRGNTTHKKLKMLGVSYLHTTNLPNMNCDIIYDNTLFDKSKIIYAKQGDILISRVGSIGKIAMIKSGIVPISDCIYRIRLPEKNRQLVWDSLVSSSGFDWFKANSHGVCAKVISKSDLLNFPITLK